MSNVYDHLTVNDYHQPKQIITNSSNLKSNCEHLHMLNKRKYSPLDQQEKLNYRYKMTNMSFPETIMHHSISNQTYDKSMIRKSLIDQNISEYQQIKSNSNQILPISSSKRDIKSMDFRPLIINRRSKFDSMPSVSSSMIIIKKKSPLSVNHITLDQVFKE